MPLTAVPPPAPTARLLALLLVCCAAVGCSSSADAPARFAADGAKKLSCMQHQTVAPGSDYTDPQRSDLGRNLTVFKYYVLNGAVKYCDDKGPNADDRAWAQFVAKETGNRASVAAILDAPAS